MTAIPCVHDARANVNSTRFVSAFESLSLLQSAAMRYTHTLLTLVGVACLTLAPPDLSHASALRGLVAERRADTCAAEPQGQLQPPTQPPTQTLPSPTVVDTACIEFVDVELGQAAQIVRTDGQPLTGTWQADFGQMLSDGTYIAPRNISAPGVDRIVFHAEPVGAPAIDFTIWVHLVPSMRQPVPESREIVVGLAPTEPSQNPEMPPLSPQSNELQTTLEQAPDEMLNPGPPQYLEAVQVEGETAYVVPAYFQATFAPMTLAVRLAYPEQGVKRSKCGVFAPLTGNCIDGTTAFKIGPIKEMVTSTWQTRSMSILVDAIGSLISGLPQGLHTVTFEFRTLVRYQYTDFYECVNGSWRFKRTTICHRYGIEYRSFSPAGAARLEFPNGPPMIDWGPQECRDYAKP